MAYARKIVDDAEDSLLERAAEDQRRVLWLVLVGLVVIFVFGITGHREILLYGALGGILAPLTTRWQYRADDQPEKLRTRADADAEYVKSWGVLLLGPVAGALAAYGGLLLLSFLSDPEFSVLGEIFQSNSWSEPSTTIALALALLFGYSGGLFGKIALSASNQVLPSSASSTPAQATPPTEGHVEEPQGGAPAPVPQSMPFEGDTRHESTTATAGLAVPSNDGAKSERDHPAGRSTLASLADLAGTVVNAMGDPPSAERQANDSDATPQEDGGAEFEVTAADTEGEHNADQGPSDAAPDGVEASSGGEGSDPRS